MKGVALFTTCPHTLENHDQVKIILAQAWQDVGSLAVLCDTACVQRVVFKCEVMEE